MKNVIIITHEFFPYAGGVAVYVLETARALAAAGCTVEVWCPPHPELAAHTHEWPFTVTPLPAGNRGTQDWRCRLATAHVWRKRSKDIRNAFVWLAEPGAVLTACYAGLLRLPTPAHTGIFLHGSEILNFTRLPHRRWLFNRLLTRADTVGVISQFTRKILLKHTAVDPAKIRVAPGALRADWAFRLRAPVPAAAKEINAGNIVLCVARIHPRKGQLELLEAVAALPEPLRRDTLTRFVGQASRKNYSYHKKLEHFATTAGLRVEFAGKKQGAALDALFSEATIFALPSSFKPNSFESFGIVYLEAGAHALPVVAHDTGGVPEAVVDGETGLLVPSGDRQALSTALRRLLETPSLRHFLGENGRRRAATFSWDQNVKTLFASFLEISPP
ncbi:MAG: glycosyltransferase family 4 protein [Puniceicoccales bacterium]|jgi:phosphatidylinositol alpha-1,6-mannosyltransferase|nr:glycosyltransferase family 4 protein [Puniceicoccales bacterium]